MALEAYSATKPSLPYRGWISAVLLLLLSTGLALAMTWNRGERALAERVQPAGWDLSFRVPIGFDPERHDAQPDSATYRFRANLPNGLMAELALWKMDARADLSATQVADRVLQSGDSFWLRAILGNSATRSVERMGGMDAVELVDLSIPMVARAVVLENRVAYAVSLRIVGGPIDEALYQLYEMTCRTVEFNAAFRRGRS